MTHQSTAIRISFFSDSALVRENQNTSCRSRCVVHVFSLWNIIINIILSMLHRQTVPCYDFQDSCIQSPILLRWCVYLKDEGCLLTKIYFIVVAKLAPMKSSHPVWLKPSTNNYAQNRIALPSGAAYVMLCQRKVWLRVSPEILLKNHESNIQLQKQCYSSPFNTTHCNSLWPSEAIWRYRNGS